MAKQYKIILRRPGCIGAGPCTANAPDFFTFDYASDNKVNFNKEKNPTTNKDGSEEIIIDEKDLEANREAAQVCPERVIHIIDLETGEKLI